MIRSSLGALLLISAAIAAAPLPARQAAKGIPARTDSRAIAELIDYLAGQHSTGFIILRDGKPVLDRRWPAPDDPRYRPFMYGSASDGALLEDVASQQKSFVAVLCAIALDKGLLDFGKPVSAYLGAGWSKAPPEQEAAITIDHLLQMNTGLDERFAPVAAPGAVFFYNTPVYATLKRVLVAATSQSLEALTTAWLTAPAGMGDTGWRKRPAAFAGVGNDTGLVTTPEDTARFGQMVLAGGIAPNGTRIISTARLRALFARSPTNPSYGRLWWRNGGAYAIRAGGVRNEGPLIPAAPADTIAALGAGERRLYIVPSRKLVIVRTGAPANDRDFDQQLWSRLKAVLG
jgi:CubicO group peptidase (beta-lactamase class C family)